VTGSSDEELSVPRGKPRRPASLEEVDAVIGQLADEWRVQNR